MPMTPCYSHSYPNNIRDEWGAEKPGVGWLIVTGYLPSGGKKKTAAWGNHLSWNARKRSNEWYMNTNILWFLGAYSSHTPASLSRFPGKINQKYLFGDTYSISMPKYRNHIKGSNWMKSDGSVEVVRPWKMSSQTPAGSTQDWSFPHKAYSGIVWAN